MCGRRVLPGTCASFEENPNSCLTDKFPNSGLEKHDNFKLLVLRLHLGSLSATRCSHTVSQRSWQEGLLGGEGLVWKVTGKARICRSGINISERL